MKLINKQGQTVSVGDTARTSSDEVVIITGWREPQHVASTGRVYVVSTDERKFHREYFPSVCGMQWVGGEK